MKSVTECYDSDCLGPNLSLLASFGEDPASQSTPQGDTQTKWHQHCCMVVTVGLRNISLELHLLSTPKGQKQILDVHSAHSIPTPSTHTGWSPSALPPCIVWQYPSQQELEWSHCSHLTEVRGPRSSHHCSAPISSPVSISKADPAHENTPSPWPSTSTKAATIARTYAGKRKVPWASGLQLCPLHRFKKGKKVSLLH